MEMVWKDKCKCVTVIFGRQIKMVRKYQLVLLSVGENNSLAEVNTNMHGKVFQDSELKHGFLLQWRVQGENKLFTHTGMGKEIEMEKVKGKILVIVGW